MSNRSQVNDIAGYRGPPVPGCLRRSTYLTGAATAFVLIGGIAIAVGASLSGCAADNPAVAAFDGGTQQGGVQENDADASLDGAAQQSGPNTGLDAGIIIVTDAGRVRAPTQDASMPGLILEVIDECGPSNEPALSAQDVQRLKLGGSSDGMAYLYPYGGTVFPRGLKAPLIMWKGGAGKAVYLRIRSQYFQYEGCFKPTSDGQLQLKQEIWQKVGLHTLGASTPYTIELTTLDGGSVHGPIREEVIVAQATLKGSLYYNSYNTQQVAGGGAPVDPLGGGGFNGDIGNGAIMRIRPGGDAEYFLRMETCTGCHSVSANGKRLVAQEALGDPPGQVYELAPDTKPNPAPKVGVQNPGFVGLSPDGSVYITSSFKNGLGPFNAALAAGQIFGFDSFLIETDTGRSIANSNVPTSVMMPTFSPDGTLVVFNDYMKGNGYVLTLMDYDAKARRASNERTIYMSSSAAGYVAWPFMLPDNQAVIFTEGESAAFGGEAVFLLSPPPGPRSDLKIVDIKSGKATLLARAMGFAGVEDAVSGKTYLPFGAEELHQSYYPTVSPVASGGYFWVFFDSVRHYGNRGLLRQLWGAAITVRGDGNYSADPSHPAFYVAGQEFGTANHRAFAALDPCRQDGSSCDTGIDCCSGFCTDGVCGPPRQCANTDEACKTDADCCNPDDQCIGGFCGTVTLL
jgi:hypothetical protein